MSPDDVRLTLSRRPTCHISIPTRVVPDVRLSEHDVRLPLSDFPLSPWDY